jgi:thiamine-monophosphate kinase
MRSRQVGELALLKGIRRQAGRWVGGGLRLGIGDDCALLLQRPAEELAVTTDLSIAGRHFRVEWHPPESVGHRTLARGLSDLAAMGARPLATFLSIGLPRNLTAGSPRSARTTAKSWFDHFLTGFLALADSFQVPLAGGDLAESPIPLADIVLVGAVPRGQALLRSGARHGDLLYVTGTLGGSSMGLECLGKFMGSGAARPRGIPHSMRELLAPHLYPQPRLAQGRYLQRRGLASSAIDLSDGLSTDLSHLCAESEVSAEVDSAALPIHPGATLELALHGGEDYELLFTARPSARIPRTIAGVPVTRIGRILRKRRKPPQAILMTPSGSQALTPRGWEHFS